MRSGRNGTFSRSDERWMRRALDLARRGNGRVHPNPMVGCVLVWRGRIISEGWHRRYGEAHAEEIALRRAGRRARGATMYVNLEPCSHWGHTPPCDEMIARAGVARVVAACRDPNPLVNGKGFRFLRRAGVEVRVGLLREEASRINAVYFRRFRNHP